MWNSILKLLCHRLLSLALKTRNLSMWNSILKLLCHRLLSLALKTRNSWRASRPSDPLSYRWGDGSNREMKVRMDASRSSFVVVDVPDRLSVNV